MAVGAGEAFGLCLSRTNRFDVSPSEEGLLPRPRVPVPAKGLGAALCRGRQRPLARGGLGGEKSCPRATLPADQRRCRSGSPHVSIPQDLQRRSRTLLTACSQRLASLVPKARGPWSSRSQQSVAPQGARGPASSCPAAPACSTGCSRVPLETFPESACSFQHRFTQRCPSA